MAIGDWNNKTIPGPMGPMGPKGDLGDGRPSWEYRSCELCESEMIVQCTRVLNFFVCMNCEIGLKNRLKTLMKFQ
jgi:hypothetical protein